MSGASSRSRNPNSVRNSPTPSAPAAAAGRGVGRVADVREQLDVVAVGGVPVPVERPHLCGERQRGHDLVLGGVDRDGPRGTVDEHQTLGQHRRFGTAGRHDGRDAPGAGEDRRVRRRPARPGDDRQHPLGVERRDDRGGEVRRDQHERRLVRGDARGGAAGELGDEPVADVGDVAGPLREVAAERLELRGHRLRRLPDRALGDQPVVDDPLLGVGHQGRVGGDRGGGVQQVGTLAVGAVGGRVERGADHLGGGADPLRDGGVVGAGREPSARGWLRDGVRHEHRGRDDAAWAHPDAGDDRGGWRVHRTRRAHVSGPPCRPHGSVVPGCPCTPARRRPGRPV